MTPPITDHNTYLADLSRGIHDKLFFVGRIHPTLVVDYGCADGQLLTSYHHSNPDATLVGYDHDERMVTAARGRRYNPVFFYSDWKSVECEIDDAEGEGTSAIILSSVIHEVMGYGNDNDVRKFWSRVWHSQFDYVVVRDMMIEDHIWSCEADLEDVEAIIERTPARKLAQWEGRWGPITELGSLTHFLLTYQYEDNWERELLEDYLPISTQQMRERAEAAGYGLTYWVHERLPYHVEKVKQDYGIEVPVRTHVKAIFARGDM